MLKLTLAAVALATGLVSPVYAQQWGAGAPAAAAPSRVEASATPQRTPSARESTRAHAAADAVITETHITRLRATLKLTPAQQSLWGPVEVALSELARQQASGKAAGFTQKFSDRGSATAATATQLRRLKAIAMPLIQSLDEGQKRNAISFARNLGFQQLVAAF